MTLLHKNVQKDPHVSSIQLHNLAKRANAKPTLPEHSTWQSNWEKSQQDTSIKTPTTTAKAKRPTKPRSGDDQQNERPKTPKKEAKKDTKKSDKKSNDKTDAKNKKQDSNESANKSNEKSTDKTTQTDGKQSDTATSENMVTEQANSAISTVLSIGDDLVDLTMITENNDNTLDADTLFEDTDLMVADNQFMYADTTAQDFLPQKQAEQEIFDPTLFETYEISDTTDGEIELDTLSLDTVADTDVQIEQTITPLEQQVEQNKIQAKTQQVDVNKGGEQITNTDTGELKTDTTIKSDTHVKVDTTQKQDIAKNTGDTQQVETKTDTTVKAKDTGNTKAEVAVEKDLNRQDTKQQTNIPVRETLQRAETIQRQVTTDPSSVSMDDLSAMIEKLRTLEERAGVEKQLQKAMLESAGIRRSLESKMLEKQTIANNAQELNILRTQTKLTTTAQAGTADSNNANAQTAPMVQPLAQPLSPTLARATSLTGDTTTSLSSGNTGGNGDNSGGNGGQQQGGKDDQKQGSYTSPKSESRIMLDLSQQHNWQKTLAMRAFNIAQGKGEAKLQLHPSELGALIIKVQVHDGDTRIKMIAEKEETARMLTQNKETLEQFIGEQGMNFREFDMSHGSASDFSDGNNDGKQDNQFAREMDEQKQLQQAELDTAESEKSAVADNRLVDAMA